MVEFSQSFCHIFYFVVVSYHHHFSVLRPTFDQIRDNLFRYYLAGNTQKMWFKLLNLILVRKKTFEIELHALLTDKLYSFYISAKILLNPMIGINFRSSSFYLQLFQLPMVVLYILKANSLAMVMGIIRRLKEVAIMALID